MLFEWILCNAGKLMRNTAPAKEALVSDCNRKFCFSKTNTPWTHGVQQAKLATSRNKILAAKLQGSAIAQYLRWV